MTSKLLHDLQAIQDDGRLKPTFDDVIEAMEPPCPLVDCTSCVLVQGCALPSVLDRASMAFRAEFAKHSLADIIGQ